MFSTTMYYRNKTSVDSGLNETDLDDGASFISNSTASPGKDVDDDDGISPNNASSSSLTLISFRIILKWYALIFILSILVLTGIIFAVCRLSLKAEAFRKSGANAHQDSLLFADYRASALPISLDLDENSDL